MIMGTFIGDAPKEKGSKLNSREIKVKSESFLLSAAPSLNNGTVCVGVVTVFFF